LALVADGDVQGVAALVKRYPALTNDRSYKAHALLRQLVSLNKGHCYKKLHRQIADVLTPASVRSFREAILNDQVDVVRHHLQADADLIYADFTAGRGIAQAIHHWTSLAVAGLCLDAGADIESLTTLGESPLTMQLRFGTVEGVRYLLQNGANPNNGVGGHMPSDTMAERIELLLAHGWDTNHGLMLHDANHGHGARIKTWLKYGADPNAKNDQGQTALHLIAARGTGRDAIHTLIKAGADPDLRDQDGHTPLDLARAARQQSAAQALMARGANKTP
jgi:ankyrin repeat protein